MEAAGAPREWVGHGRDPDARAAQPDFERARALEPFRQALLERAGAALQGGEPVGEALGAGAEPGEPAGEPFRGAFELPDPFFEPAARLRPGG